MATVARPNLMTEAPWPVFAADEIAAVQRVLESGKVNYWTGDEGRKFETEFAAWCGSKRAIAMMNGSVTIEAALAVYGIGPGDEVICTPRSFMASASSVVLRGATPVWADVDRASGNISAETIERVMTSRAKAILPVHLAGYPCEMGPMMDLVKGRDIAVIEDCAQAHGATIDGQSVGTFGPVSSWSFCQDKILTTGGEGGMVTTDDEALWSAMWSLKDHGKSWEAVYERPHPPGFRWVHETFGSNWRMTEVQSAIGRVILRKLPEWTALRTRNANLLLEALTPLSALRMETPREGMAHAWYKFYCYVRPEALKPDWSRDRIMEAISARGIPAFSGSCSEMYLEKNFQDAGLAPAERLPVAKELGETSLMFLVHPTLTEEHMRRAAEVIVSVVLEATR